MNWDCSTEEFFAIDTSEFNTYAAEWNGKEINFFINDQKIKTIRQSPDYPMQFMLNIYDVSDEKQTTQEMEFIVDYVCGYQWDNADTV